MQRILLVVITARSCRYLELGSTFRAFATDKLLDFVKQRGAPTALRHVDQIVHFDGLNLRIELSDDSDLFTFVASNQRHFPYARLSRQAVSITALNAGGNSPENNELSRQKCSSITVSGTVPGFSTLLLESFMKERLASHLSSANSLSSSRQHSNRKEPSKE